MTGLAIAAILLLIAPAGLYYTARQRPLLPFLAASLVGGLAGWVVGSGLATWLLSSRPAPEPGIVLVGLVAAAWGQQVAAAAAGCCVGSRDQRRAGRRGARHGLWVGAAVVVLALAEPLWRMSRQPLWHLQYETVVPILAILACGLGFPTTLASLRARVPDEGPPG